MNQKRAGYGGQTYIEYIVYYHVYMKQWFEEYGKVSICIVAIFISIILCYEIISLITPQKLRVSFLDVGQGDSILIQTPSGHDMLIDGGATNIVLERLAKQMSFFDRSIDVVVATHPDADHVTGLIPVLEKYNVEKIIISKVEGETGIFEDLNNHIKNEGAHIIIAEVGDEINFNDDVSAKILFPTKNYIAKKNDTNDASVSMVLQYDDITFLLTGDLPTTNESKLISGGLTKNITVYKAGHHGSKSSSGEQLLTYIRPEYAIISAGKDNTYGHPNIETLERLQKYAKEIVSTIDRGTISFRTDGRLLEIKTTK
jgi:competence protein ComEC